MAMRKSGWTAEEFAHHWRSSGGTVTAPGAVTKDDGFWRVTPASSPDWTVKVDRCPPPAEADLVTIWKKDRRVVMSVTADGKTNDFYMPPARLVYLLREVAGQLAESTILQ